MFIAISSLGVLGIGKLISSDVHTVSSTDLGIFPNGVLNDVITGRVCGLE